MLPLSASCYFLQAPVTSLRLMLLPHASSYVLRLSLIPPVSCYFLQFQVTSSGLLLLPVKYKHLPQRHMLKCLLSLLGFRL